MRNRVFTLLTILLIAKQSVAHDIKKNLSEYVDTLCSPSFYGRGYVNNGNNKAAEFILTTLKDLGLKTKVQKYTFPVNTYDGQLIVALNGKPLEAGKDFILDPGSPSFNGDNLIVTSVDLSSIKTEAQWEKLKSNFIQSNTAYLLLKLDSMCKYMHKIPQLIGSELPRALYFIPTHGKMNYEVSTHKIDADVIFIQDSALPKIINKASVFIESNFISAYKNKNIMAILPGKIKDSFIVITAHYDHLGMMGKDALFPGASDNASGTAMLLYLASNLSQIPLKYSVLFIAFSGEEAGLKGSEYYVQHPTYPLSKIHFLINLDIMGDASDGVTVVNATQNKTAFALLNSINAQGNFLPHINSRGKAANSDHYYFTEAGVPAFFIYTCGGKGFYHDIYDKPSSLSYTNIDKLAELLKRFILDLSNGL